VARNTTHIDAPPAAVWRVLDDPFAYPRWVVGTERTVSADPGFPAPGTSFDVHVAFGHVDRTTVVALDPGRRIVLDAAARVLGPARVTIETRAEDGGTALTLIEDPHGKAMPLRLFPPVHLLIRLRNVEALRRLRRIVRERA
jgi:uncharacterized protein YndB with AHSA1/START domain